MILSMGLVRQLLSNQELRLSDMCGSSRVVPLGSQGTVLATRSPALRNRGPARLRGTR